MPDVTQILSRIESGDPTAADQLLPLADFAFPNAYELEYLTGGRTDSLGAALSAADAFLTKMRSGGTVIITSLLRACRCVRR